jgi:cell division protein FtsB
MKPQMIFIVILIALLALLQYKLWFSVGGVTQYWQLKNNIAQVVQENRLLQEKNARVIAEIKDLKHADTAIEERARNDLGLIKPGEIFYQIVQ